MYTNKTKTTADLANQLAVEDRLRKRWIWIFAGVAALLLLLNILLLRTLCNSAWYLSWLHPTKLCPSSEQSVGKGTITGLDIAGETIGLKNLSPDIQKLLIQQNNLNVTVPGQTADGQPGPAGAKGSTGAPGAPGASGTGVGTAQNGVSLAATVLELGGTPLLHGTTIAQAGNDFTFDATGAGGNLLVTGEYGAGTDLAVSGPGTRLVWYPKKSALRAGTVTVNSAGFAPPYDVCDSGAEWNDACIGNNTVVFGQNSIATANYAITIGVENQATGIGSFSLGFDNISSGYGSISIGSNTISSGFDSLVLGEQSQATGSHSVAIGYANVASGDAAVSFGTQTLASGGSSTAFGSNTIASQSLSTAFGDQTIASGFGSTAFGSYSVASGYQATAFGLNTTASGDYSIAFGTNTINYLVPPFFDVIANCTDFGFSPITSATGYGAVAFGACNTASGAHSTAFGINTTASGSMTATSFGISTTASGIFSTAFGSNSLASGDNSTAFGQSTIASGEFAVAFGYNSEASGARSTAFGESTQATNNAAVAFGNSTVASGEDSTAFGSGTLASGTYSTAFGINTAAKGAASLAVGQSITVDTTAIQTIGFGLDNTPRTITQANSFVVVGGKTGLGTVAPTMQLEVSDTTTTNVAKFDGSGGTQCTVVTGTGWSCSSDETLKTNILSINNGLNIVTQLQGVTYNWKSDPTGTRQDGFIAQDIQKILPELVTTDSNGKLSLNKDGIMPFIVEAIKEQNGNLDKTNQQLSDQGIKLTSLSDELVALTKQVDDNTQQLKDQQSQIDKLTKMVEQQAKDIQQLKSATSNSTSNP